MNSKITISSFQSSRRVILAQIELIFDHVGIPTDEVQPDEDWVESTRVWVTSPRANKYRIEYLRYEPDTPCRAELVNLPHVAYQVHAEDLSALIEGAEILSGPFVVDQNLTVAFIMKDGIPTEYMVYVDPDIWFGKRSPFSSPR
ncbi:MAG: hypothetical protein ABI835_05615 [Chloroflexota bacterium]